MTDSPAGLLHEWLRRQLPPDSLAWLEAQLPRVGDGGDRELQIALGMAPRRLGKDDLALTDADLARAAATRPGWDPRGWSVDQAARILLLLGAGGPADRFPARFRELCRTADPAEAVALYRGLPLYPVPERLEAQAAEGLRTNMRTVFEAVAHRSPYPRERFDQGRWNQMVLKALFVGSTLAPIQGLDERANAELALILRDYAHERWAAGRRVSPELWRCVGPFAAETGLDDLRRAAAEGDAAGRQAAALALAACPGAEAADLLASLPEAAAVASGALTWDSLNPGP